MIFKYQALSSIILVDPKMSLIYLYLPKCTLGNTKLWRKALLWIELSWLRSPGCLSASGSPDDKSSTYCSLLNTTTMVQLLLSKKKMSQQLAKELYETQCTVINGHHFNSNCSVWGCIGVHTTKQSLTPYTNQLKKYQYSCLIRMLYAYSELC